ncbi:MAG: hypothetical protein MJ252_08705 [archaeon]|nr:hypothetical protein [archaeon]
MPFVKIQKNNTYSKRFQVKFRRRRIGKTDYYQRKRLTLQRKNKYNTPKYRFVVRRTNTKIICQIMWATLKGDKVKSYADSSELKRFGLTAGLTNYASAYCTGLLCSRRLLTLLDKENEGKEGIDYKMAEIFNLIPEAKGEYVDFKGLCEEKGVEQRPFTAYLDLGLVRATNGNRVFAAVKGAVDGGIHIQHSEKVFPGHGKEGEDEEKDKKAKKPAGKGDKKGKENENIFRDRIFGVHVQKWMDEYSKRDDAQKHQFSQWKECLKKAGVKKVEDLYKKIHSEIRKNPLKPEKKAEKPKYKRKDDDKNIIVAPSGKEFRRDFRLTNAQRKERVKDKIRKYLEERKK